MWSVSRMGLRVAAVALLDGCALFRSPLVLPVGRDDGISDVVDRHAEEIGQFLREEDDWARLSPDEVAQKVLKENLYSLMFGARPGNRIAIHRDGRLEVLAGMGPSPEEALTAEKAKAAMDDLFAEMPEEVHEHVILVAEQAGIRMQVHSVSTDRRSLRVGEETYTAAEGILFVPHKGHLHVVGTSELYRFDIPVWPVEGVRFSFPLNPYFSVSPTRSVELKSDVEATLARMLAQGEINTADEKYHITRKFEFEPWQKLVHLASSEDTPALLRRLATELEITLLSEDLGIDSDNFARGIARMRTRIGRAWLAFDAKMSSQEINFVMAHNAALDMGGKLLYLGDQMLSAGEGLRFSLCKEHIHILGSPSLGIDVSIEPPQKGRRLESFANAFVKLEGDHVVMRELHPDVVKLLVEGQIAPKEHAYHITEKFYPEVQLELRAAIAGTSVESKLRESLRKTVADASAQALPITSSESLQAALRRLRRRFDQAFASLNRYRQEQAAARGRTP